MRIAVLDDYQGAAGRHGDWNRLPADVELVVFGDHVADEDRLVARLKDFDAVCRIRERTPFPRRVIERLPRLKLILATGMRNAETLDLKAAQECGITVCATGSGGNAAIELCWGLILSLSRGIHTEAASLRSGGWQIGIGTELRGRTLGIVGLGRHGTQVARIAQVFGMATIAWSPNLTQDRAAQSGVTRVAKADLFRRSDVVTIHMPLSDRSRGLIGAAELAVMRPHAFLVNISRGPLVDETELLGVLRAGRIAGYAADVFDDEPLPANHPFRYLPNVLATPHIGFASDTFFEVIFRETVENILAYLEGKPIRVLAPGDG